MLRHLEATLVDVPLDKLQTQGTTGTPSDTRTEATTQAPLEPPHSGHHLGLGNRARADPSSDWLE